MALKERNRATVEKHREAIEMLELIHQRKKARVETKMDLVYQKQALRVLSPSLNKRLYTVEERLQMARFQQACELDNKRQKLESQESSKEAHLLR